MPTKILAIDQGTTSTRAILFDERLDILAVEQQEFAQYYPHSGWVEHDPEDLWNSTIAVVKGVLAKTGTRAEHTIHFCAHPQSGAWPRPENPLVRHSHHRP